MPKLQQLLDEKKTLVDSFIEYCDGTNMFESYESDIAKKNATECAKVALRHTINELIKCLGQGESKLLSVIQENQAVLEESNK